MALSIGAAIVVDAIGEVRILLDLAKDHARANGVRRTSGNEKGVTRADGMAFEEILKCVRRESFEKSLLADAGFQPDEHLRAGLGGDGVPHLRLACAACALFVSSGVGVIGMNLDRKLIHRENELEEKGKIAGSAEMAAAPIRRHFVPGFAQGLSREVAGGNAAVESGEPGFADRFREIGFLREKRREGTRAPDARGENGFDAKWLGIHRLHRVCQSTAKRQFPRRWRARFEQERLAEAKRRLRRARARLVLSRAASGKFPCSFCRAPGARSRWRGAPRYSGRRRRRRRAIRR